MEELNIPKIIDPADVAKFNVREWVVRIMARNMRDGYTYTFDEYRIPEDDSRPVSDELRRQIAEVCRRAAKEVESLLVNR